MVAKYQTKKSDERDARRADAKKAVDDGVKSLLEEIQQGRTERLVAWLDFCSQFHRYSAANQHLIAEQARRRSVRASHVASYAAWQALGQTRHGKPYQVRKGEKAIFIWAPRPYVKNEVNKKTKQEEEHAYVGFVLVPVFDASQIAQGIDETGYEHPPLEHFFTPQPNTEEASRLYETLKSIATGEGFTCREEHRQDGVQGYNQGKLIVVKASLDATSKFNVFIHELAHALLHQDTTLGQRDREGEAEATAYITARHFGVSNPFSSDYLQMYGNTVETLTARLTRIRDTAHALIEKLEKALGTAEGEQVEEAAAA